VIAGGVAAVLDAIATHGPALLLGVTCVLAVGCVAVAAARTVAQRQRFGAATARGLAVYLLLAAVPLPRWWNGTVASAAAVAETAAPPAVLPAAVRTGQLRDALALLAAGSPALPSPGSAAPAAADAPVPLAVPANVLPGARAARGVAVSTLLAAAWLLGAVLMLLRVAGGWVRLCALLARCRTWADAPQVGLPRGARVLVSSHPLRPFCAGVLRPVVVVPAGLLARVRRDEALAVLRHEAAHVRNGDTRLHLLLALLGTVLFFHPLFWWLCRQVRFCGELLADDVAAGADGRHRYARALLDLVERAQPPVAAVATVPVFHRTSEFYRRIHMLLQQKAPLTTITSRRRRAAHALATLALVGLAAGTFGVPAAAQDPGGRALRKENAELRETIDTLRAELASLRAQIAELGARANEPAGLPALGDLGPSTNDPDLSKRLAEIMHQVQRAQPGTPAATTLETLLGERAGRAAPSFDDLLAQPTPARPGALAPSGTAPAQPPATMPAPGQPPSPPFLPVRRAAPGTGAVDTPPLPADAAPAPAAPVPLLGEIPVIAHLFQRRDAVSQPAPASELPPETPPTALELTADPTNGLALGLATTQPNPLLQPHGGTTANALAELTSRYVDLQAEVELAQVEAEESKRMAENGLHPQREARRAAAHLRSCERKLAIARQLIDGEIAATEGELAWIDARRKDASPTEQLQLQVEAARAKTRVAALRAVK
jgi:Zn-dependent protease with chaperone function